MNEETVGADEEGGGGDDVESGTPDDRRRALVALSDAARDPKVDIDTRLLDVLARDIVEPRGEAFPGETEALVAVLVGEQDMAPFAGRVLAQAALELGAASSLGTAAGRVAMMRAVAGLLLHDRCARMAASVRSDDREEAPNSSRQALPGPAPETELQTEPAQTPGRGRTGLP